MRGKKISEEIAAEVIYKSDRKCCVCQDKRGVHIHHLDGDNTNNEFDNLAYLCFDCHDEATKTGSLSRKLSEAAIRKYRAEWYEIVESKRSAARQVFNYSVQGITGEDLLIASKNALIIVALVDVKQKYYASEWIKRSDILEDFNKYYPHTNFRLAFDVYSFCTEITEYNRGALTKDVACSIYGLIMNFFPYSAEDDSDKTIQLLEECCRVGFNITFDTAIYLKDYSTIMFGLTILKYAYKKAKEKGLSLITDNVHKLYDELTIQLQGIEYQNYLELLGNFKEDLQTNSLHFPMLTANLMRLIYPETHTSVQSLS